MDKKDALVARELKDKLAQVTEILDFRIFGSRACGNSQLDSDMDVFLEVPRLNEELDDKIQHIAWETGFKHLMFISVLIFTRHEIEESPLRSSSIVKNIMEEGVRV